MTRFYSFARFTAFSLLLMVLFLQNTYGENIEIDREHKRIVAPEGINYKWLIEGQEIKSGTGRFLNVEKSGTYSVLFEDEHGKAVEETIHIVVEGNAIRKIFLIGDSTVTNYRTSDYPMAGWGMVFQHFFDNSAFVVENKAIGGRSSKSFKKEGRWDEVRRAMKADDYVFIQFGHNDRDHTKPERFTPVDSFKIYLREYVTEARDLQAIPVLVSPMVMNAWRDGVLRNVFTESGNDYRGAMLQVANELDVPFIDLNIESHALVSEVGPDYATRFIYHAYAPGEYPNYPDGSNDFTHFQEMGAVEMAKIVANGITKLEEDARIEPLAEKLLPLYPVNIKINKPDAGTVTHSASYPAGVTVTVKVLPKDGHTFKYWRNSNGTIARTRSLHSFTMEPGEKTLYALIDEDTPWDCTGEFNGTAVTDDCGICTGGTTERAPCSFSFQMEDACSVDGELKADYVGYHGNGYVVSEAAEGAAVEWIWNAGSDEEVLLTFRYANGGETARSARLSVNDSEAGELEFAPAGKWMDWNSISQTVMLREGENTLRLSALSSAGLAHLDLISLTVTTVEAVECEPVTPPVTYIPLSQFPGKLKVFPNPFSDHIEIESGEPFNYKIYDLSGRLQAHGSCSGKCRLNPSLEPGLYQMIIENSKGSYSAKILRK